MSALLQVQQLTKLFGGLAAVRDLSFEVEKGSIVGLIGPNGAGKTTAFSTIGGALSASRGRVVFDGVDITGKRPSAIAGLGLGRTFQSTMSFAGETVARNIECALLSRIQGSAPQRLMGRRRALLPHGEIGREVDRIVEIVKLQEWRDVPAGSLAYGLQKKLGIAIALAASPSMLLMDEPAAGLNHEECRELTRLLRQLREELGLTLLLVEHHMAIVMEVCQHIVVMVQGEKIAEGSPEAIRADPAVVEAYLGAPDYAHA
ncbi:ATP-binding cassette domain-containing protein [Xylophilus rhododendri]|uniref:ATP-binding cassette domain-containing protein n=1 Tax=Xylophilus rhododendri TaxID=2697032 RepID=A0A857J189_9BURK|nr:ABC transporter ATP-binding protein [Xylophilus rhododendri]QHI97466.1 ATP-binding cassette domain-containing protein [Xylophilus rhododendri]